MRSDGNSDCASRRAEDNHPKLIVNPLSGNKPDSVIARGMNVRIIVQLSGIWWILKGTPNRMQSPTKNIDGSSRRLEYNVLAVPKSVSSVGDVTCIL